MSRPPAEPSNKERNEYIPSFIAKKPFYVGDDTSDADYLEHQRLQNKKTDDSKWYDRGKKLGPAATKFRKGACENCGAMTHKTKECLSRPRKLGAKWTGKDIQADEVVQKMDMGWDAKRDRWNGYDAREYRNVIKEHEELEALKKKAAGSRNNDAISDDEDTTQNDNSDAKYAEESDMGRHQSTATRQLRLREDTAKYLLNLDLDSAKYDPKTRSMVDMGATQDSASALVADENFMRSSGDAEEFEKAQKYAWESQERGDKDKQHLQANPTAGEHFRRKQVEENAAKKAALKKALLDKYGGEAHLQPSSLRDTAVLENERFVEYDESGGIKGAIKAPAKSKYPEDIFINNHTSVWGSWWCNFTWGYACCHSTVKNSYCTGEDGKRAFEEAENRRLGEDLVDGNDDDNSHGREIEDAPSLSESAPPVTTKQEENLPVKKRTLAEMQAGISEQEMEEYKRSRTAADDPMAKMLGRDELLE